MPEGYPGLRQQIQAAQAALVFGPEDRAPHGLFFACGRIYASQLHSRLQESRSFEVDPRPEAEILAVWENFNTEWELQHHSRLPYLYGVWKAKKESFRWISGTSRKLDPPKEGPKEEEEGPPKNAASAVG